MVSNKASLPVHIKNEVNIMLVLANRSTWLVYAIEDPIFYPIKIAMVL